MEEIIGLLNDMRWNYFKSSCPSHFILDKQEDSSDDEAEEGEVEDENSSDVEVSNRENIYVRFHYKKMLAMFSFKS